jgi:hypothetical protein
MSMLLVSLLLTWGPPATREDGSLLLPEEIENYTVYTSNGRKVVVYDTQLEIRSPKQCTSYTVTATDTNGTESEMSNIIEQCKKKGKKSK